MDVEQMFNNYKNQLAALTQNMGLVVTFRVENLDFRFEVLAEVEVSGKKVPLKMFSRWFDLIEPPDIRREAFYMAEHLIHNASAKIFESELFHEERNKLWQERSQNFVE